MAAAPRRQRGWWWLLAAVLWCAAACCPPAAASLPHQHQHHHFAPGFSVASYLPEWRYEGANWDEIARHSTHVILFSLEPARDGSVRALDRLPRPALLADALAAATAHGAQVLVCFGGNGRSDGFSGMVRNDAARARFVAAAVALVERHGLHGIDYNWEYPGYTFGRGYHSAKEVQRDYNGLAKLVRETKAALAHRGGTVTMAYYPDGRQEQLLAESGIAEHADLVHAMAYDASGQHSTMELAHKALAQAKQHLPPGKMTLGLPFYARHVRTGSWVSYEDIVGRIVAGGMAAAVLDPAADVHGDDFYNGVTTIGAKTRLAVAEAACGGVMVWEAGQDCRLAEVQHGKDMHVQTCPSREWSLFNAIRAAYEDEAAAAAASPAATADEL